MHGVRGGAEIDPDDLLGAIAPQFGWRKTNAFVLVIVRGLRSTLFHEIVEAVDHIVIAIVGWIIEGEGGANGCGRGRC